MKFMMYSDLHVSELIGLLGRNDRLESGERRSIAEARKCFTWLERVASDHSVDLVINGGDLFDRSRPTPDEYAVALEGVAVFESYREHWTVVGNHDGSGGAGRDATSLLTTAHLGRVIDRPTRIEIDNDPDLGHPFSLKVPDEFAPVVFYLLPYPRRGDVVAQSVEEWGCSKEQKNANISGGMTAILAQMAARAREDRENGARTILISHVTWRGAMFNDHQVAPMADIQIPHDQIEAFDVVLGGHIHKHQKIGSHPRAWYVPPPDRWTFGDEGEWRGCCVVDTETLEVEWIEYAAARQFRTFTPSEIGAVVPALVAESFVRVKGEVGTIEEYDEAQAALAKLESVAAGIRNDVTICRQRDEVASVDPDQGIEAVFNVFCEARPDEIPEEHREGVLAVARQLVKEAL